MFYRLSEVRQTGTRDSIAFRKSASSILTDSVQFSEGKGFDVFLSHSFKDAETILGVLRIIESQGKKVYVDWVQDRGLDRENVTPATAAILRQRMRQSKSLIYASSPNTSNSKWTPWELGYFDGYKPDMVSILPLVENFDSEWKGTEYLGLYPVIERLQLSGSPTPFIVRKDSKAQLLRDFGTSTSYIWDRVYGKAV